MIDGIYGYPTAVTPSGSVWTPVPMLATTTVGTVTAGTWTPICGGGGGTVVPSSGQVLSVSAAGYPTWATMPMPETRSPKDIWLDECKSQIKDKEHLKFAYDLMVEKMEEFQMLARLSKPDEGMEE